MVVFRATAGATADDVDLGLPLERRMSSSADGPLGNGRRRGRERGGGSSSSASVPETVVLVLGNFQGVVILDMGVVTVGEGKTATLRIEAPEVARKPVTTIGIDPRHPLAGGLEVKFDGELSLGRGESHEAEVTWRPERGGKFRANVAFKVDGRFPAQVSVVGEAVDIGGNEGRGDARKGRKRAKGQSAGGGDGGKRRSLSQEAASRGARPYTSVYGKENRLSPSSAALPPAPSVLGSSTTAALSLGTTNKRQQVLKYSKSRRPSLKPTHRRGKSESAAGAGGGGSGGANGGGSKAALLRKSLDDKGWAEKQTGGFTDWLNFTLVGADQLRHGGDGGEGEEEDGGLTAQTGVSSSPLKAMVAMRHEARQRMRAMLLFRSAEIREVTETVLDRAHDGTIALRRDRVLHADVGLSGALVDLVLCYEPRWLVLGLETVFGEIVPMPTTVAATATSWSSSSSSSAKSYGRVERALRTFVSERLVKSPEIKAKYGFRGRVASGWSEVDYNDEVGRHALTNFLNLVLFLDRAKLESLLHPCPCLFRKAAEVKSSVGMLKVFCQFLHGEGDFVRHLKKMGYVVGHVQSYIDEFDFHVSNLAVDLRDGVRLTRLMEVVTGEWGLAVGLRVPAVSRLQKVFNTRKALERLEKDAGRVTLGNTVNASASANGGGTGSAAAITPKDIVEGDRHATLRLLWFIITRYSLSALLDRDALAREAEGVVTAAKKWRRAGSSPARPERAMRKIGAAAVVGGDDAAAAAAGGSGGDFGGVMSPGSPASPMSPPSGGRAVAGEEHPPLKLPDVAAFREGWAEKKEGGEDGGGSGGGGGRGDDELLSALLIWCQAVCHGYGVPVRNFTTSFADGRALCLLLHYYHPRIIPLNAIRRTTAHLPRIGGSGDGSGDDSGELEDWSASLDASTVTEAECRAALDGERANVALARHCVGELGGVPSMLAPFDSTNRPEEKTIITVVAHLCARLLESSAEIRSTILVQRVYRSFLERTGRGDLVERARAAKARARAKAAADRAANRAAAAAAAAVVGRHGAVPFTPPARRGSGVGGAAPPPAAVAALPLLPEQNMYLSEKQRARLAAVTIQRWWAAGAEERLRRLGLATAAAAVQAAWRGRAAREGVRAERAERAEQAERERERRISEAALRIQAAVRGRPERQAFLLSKSAASVLQMWVRGRLQRRWYLALIGQLSAVVRLQALARGVAGRRRAAAVREVWQMQVRAARENSAATAIQAWWRFRSAQHRFSIARRAAVRLQSLARGGAEAARYRRARTAIVAIQALQRGVEARTRLSKERASRAQAEREAGAAAAAARLQALFRGVLARTHRRGQEIAVTVLQARLRGVAGRTRAADRRTAAVVLQRWGRVALEELRYKRIVRAACVVQAWGRGVVARRRSGSRRAAVVRVQAWARGALEAGRFRRALRAAVALQSLQRGAAARAGMAARHGAAVRVQAVARGRKEASLFRKKRAAAVRLQSWARGAAARRELARRQGAAVVVQAWTRAVVAGKRYQEAKNAAVVVQAWWRGASAARRFRELARAAVVVQARARAVSAVARYRRAVKAVKTIQSHWRGAAAVARYHKDVSAVVRIQARWRAALGALRYRRAIAAVVATQSAWRGVHARRRLAQQAPRAIDIQAWWRMVAVRAHAGKQKSAAVGLQAALRGMAARATYRRAVRGGLVLQALARGAQTRARLARDRQEAAEREAAVLAAKAQAAAVVIQACHRARVARKRRVEAEQAAAAAVARVAATLRVQAAVRGIVARRAIRATAAAATVVQAYARGRRARGDLFRRRAAAVRIQSVARAASASALAGRMRATLSRRTTAAVAVQRWWRSERELSRLAAARTMQAFARGVVAWAELRRRQARLREERERAVVRAAVAMQAWWRMVAAGAERRRARRGAVAVQARHHASTRVAAWWRAAAEARRYCRTRRQVVFVQSLLRGRLGREEVAARWLAVGRRFSKHKAAAMIQAAARGRATRKRTGPGIAYARARIEKANANAIADPSQILGTRVNDALVALEHCTHLTAIIRACIALELTSRYSKVCCEVMARSRCPQVLYDLIRGLNRSPPHQKILKYAITTFRNIAQRGDNLPALLAAPPVAAETYVDLLQVYRERQEVFLPTVRLLQQLVTAHKPTKDECNSVKHAPRLKSLRDILARKVAVEAKSSAARGGLAADAGGTRSARSVKAIQLLLDELARK